MSRYIDADKLIEEINERITAAIEWGKRAETDEITVRAEQAIATFCEASLIAKKLLTADVVEVVRCKDCKHYSREGKVTRYAWCYKWKNAVNFGDYCSYGERTDT